MLSEDRKPLKIKEESHPFEGKSMMFLVPHRIPITFFHFGSFLPGHGARTGEMTPTPPLKKDPETTLQRPCYSANSVPEVNVMIFLILSNLNVGQV